MEILNIWNQTHTGGKNKNGIGSVAIVDIDVVPNLHGTTK
jgi:hypothetical protein